MLHVLDEPTACRIIVETKYPNLESKSETAYFMVDRGTCGEAEVDENGKNVIDADGNIVWKEGDIWDYWQVNDSLGQCRRFHSHGDLINFFGDIEDVITKAYVDSF